MRHGPIALVTLFAFLLLTLPAGHAFANTPPPPEAPPAPEDPNLAQARARFEAGKHAYEARNYPRAIEEFRAAEAIRPSPILHYNIGLAYEGLGRLWLALRNYRAYLAQRPDAPNRAEVEQRIATLTAQAQRPEAGPPPADEPPAPATSPSTDTPGQTGQAVQVQPPQATYRGYDPYAGYAHPGAQTAPAQAPAKKKSYWWVVFPVVGGVAILGGLIALGVVYGRASNDYYYYDHALTQPAPPAGATVFTF